MLSCVIIPREHRLEPRREEQSPNELHASFSRDDQFSNDPQEHGQSGSRQPLIWEGDVSYFQLGNAGFAGGATPMKRRTFPPRQRRSRTH